jgi:hypothetical protein
MSCNAPREINFHSSIFARQFRGRIAGHRSRTYFAVVGQEP